MNVVVAALALGFLGLAFAGLLALFYRRFAVQTDPKAEELLGLLPGSNCGACGFPGCQGLAEALLAAQAEATGCVAGGPSVAARVAAFIGVSVETQAEMVAFVACRAGRNTAKRKYSYEGVENCQAASLLFGGDKLCAYGCLGRGSCVRACPFDAIDLGPEGVAVVDPAACRGCRKCVAACPRQVIAMVPKGRSVLVACRNRERGRAVKEICAIGCTACKLCEKSCPEAAILVADNLAAIDFGTCTECGICAEKCPQQTILAAMGLPNALGERGAAVGAKRVAAGAKER